MTGERHMSDNALTKKIQEMLNEEKWTRAALSNYSINNFKELDALLKEAQSEHLVDETLALCEEHLAHTKNSIIALYLSGAIGLARQTLDDSSMILLINIFSDNKKWNIVEYLCERILDHGENKHALRTLADCYHNDGDEAAVYRTWERLVKVDYEEAEIVKALAELKDKEGAREQAVDLYKKALHRFINKKALGNVKELWGRLLHYCPEDIDFFLHVQKKIAKQISDDKAALLLHDLYAIYKEKASWDTALEILKIILSYDDKDSWARKEVVECYRGKYAGHSHLEDYIKLSNLAQSYRSVHEAIGDFEKHIAFDKGNFVSHRTWGIGRISSIEGDEIVIDFAQKRGHKMSLKMAVSALSTLSRDHIWVLKTIWKKEKLHDKVKADVEWALKTIIRSFDNRADFKRIKAELVPAVLSVSEWTSWSSQARETLKGNPSFGNSQEDIDVYIVRERPLGIEEKIYNQFKAEKNFFSKLSYMRDFIDASEPDSEYFGEMFAYFTGYLKSSSQSNELAVASYLVVKDLVTKYPYLNPGFQLNFAEIFESIDNIDEAYASLKDAELRKSFLLNVRKLVPDWPDVFCKLLPNALGMPIVEALAVEGHQEKLKKLALSIIENYRDYKEAFIWFFKNCGDEPWFKGIGLPEEKYLINLIHLLDLSYKDIENHRETTLNRKISKQIHGLLFKDGALAAQADKAERDTVTRIYTLVHDVKDLDPGDKQTLRKRILARFPDFKFYGEETRAVVSRGLIVTAAKYEEKQRLLHKIMEEEVPQNSKEIAYALSLGDLRENAEYKAAKEKQELLNNTVAKLKHEIERAQLFDKSSLQDSRVSFGTVVSLTNEASGNEETYTILGPWESDPERGVISYLSPFGSELLNHRKGDRLDFVINERKCEYTVKSIEAAKF